MSVLLVDAGWDNAEPTPIFWDAVTHLFGEGSTPTLPPTGPPPAHEPDADPDAESAVHPVDADCSCAMSESSMWSCLVHGDSPESVALQDPDATDTQVLPAVQGEWLSETEFAPFEDGPDTLTPECTHPREFTESLRPGEVTTHCPDCNASYTGSVTRPRDASGRFLPKRIPGVPPTATGDAHDTPHYQSHGNDL